MLENTNSSVQTDELAENRTNSSGRTDAISGRTEEIVISIRKCNDYQTTNKELLSIHRNRTPKINFANEKLTDIIL